MKHLYLTLCTIMLSFACYAVAPITGPGTICTGSLATFSDATPGGVWTSSNTTIATIGSVSGACTAVASGSILISYTVSGTTVTTLLTVSNTPNPIVGTTSICQYAVTTLSDLIPGGDWTSSNTTVANIGSTSGYVAGLVPGTSTITYQVPTGCYTTTTFRVDAAPASISGSVYVCTGLSITLSDATPGGIWASSTTTIATITSGGVLSGLTPGVDTVSYGLSGSGCLASMYITISAPPPGITGATTVCTGYYVALTDAVTGGDWSSTNTTVATVTTFTGTVGGLSPGTTTISYSLYTGCTVSVTVTAITGAAPIAGTATVCQGSTTTLSDAGGGTWTSDATFVASVGSTGIISGVSTGSTTISYTLSTGCFATTIVTVNPLPSAISGSTYGCTSLTVTLTDATTGGVWTSGNTTIATISAGGVLSGASAGVDTITYTSSATGCSVSASVNVFTPPAPAVVTTLLDSICPDAFTYLATSVAGGTWTHANSCTGVVVGYVHGLIPGIDTIFYTVTTVCGSAVTPFPVTVRTPESCPIGHELVYQPTATPTLQVYPNPSNGAFTINMLSGVDAAVNIVIMNVTGEKIKEITARTNQPLNLELGQPQGIYIISASTPGSRIVEKIIVQ